ncbi:MAG: hypothetical protein V4485_04335, partial [Pseudomonadota bacterium]
MTGFSKRQKYKAILLIIYAIVVEFSWVSNANSAISNMIEPVKYFVDHEYQLKDLDNKLSMYKTTSLIGISGMGKTQLARTYVQRNKGNYKL